MNTSILTHPNGNDRRPISVQPVQKRYEEFPEPGQRLGEGLAHHAHNLNARGIAHIEGAK